MRRPAECRSAATLSCRLLLAAVLLAAVLSVAGCVSLLGLLPTPIPPSLAPATRLTVHFIDVGQGDAVLIQCTPGRTALIDAGPGASAESLVNYLREQGVEVIDLVIATHPHEDHIGGLPAVFAAFEVRLVVDAGVPHTTRAYRLYSESLDNEIRQLGCEHQTPKGQSVELAANVAVTVLGPTQPMETLNDSSVVSRLDFGATSFLFMGDALYAAETDLLTRGVPLRADVLKVSRHGSSTATSRQFANAVRPRYAVITVGADNPYGHPTPETLSRFAEVGAVILRTDLHGTIVIDSDGDTLHLRAP